MLYEAPRHALTKPDIDLVQMNLMRYTISEYAVRDVYDIIFISVTGAYSKQCAVWDFETVRHPSFTAKAHIQQMVGKICCYLIFCHYVPPSIPRPLAMS